MCTFSENSKHTLGNISSTQISSSADRTVSIKDIETVSPTKAQPVRKISRFLVSPVISTINNEKTVQSLQEEAITSPALPEQPSINMMIIPKAEELDIKSVHNDPNQQPFQHAIDINQTAINFVKQVVDENLGNEIASASAILSVHPHLSGKIAEFISAVNPDGTQFINPTKILSQSNAMEAKEYIQQQLKKPLGPDHINTLEQLKIELENITHVHMLNKYLADVDDTSNSFMGMGQLSPDMTFNQQMAEGNSNTFSRRFTVFFFKTDIFYYYRFQNI